MITKQYLDGPYGQLHLHRAGSGEPLVLLHQSPLDGTMFRAAFPALLDAGFSPVAIDTPGYGGSCAPPAPVSIVEFADAIVAAIRQLTAKPVQLVGHHTGASIAVSIAARYPELVSAQVLHGVALLTAEEIAYYSGSAEAPLEPQVDGSHLQEIWDQRRATTSGWADAKLMHEHVIAMLRAGDALHYGFNAVFRHDIAADLARIACPTMVMAEPSDGLFEASQRAVKQRPDFSFHALSDGERDIIEDRPGVWVEAIAGFLSQGTDR